MLWPLHSLIELKWLICFCIMSSSYRPELPTGQSEVVYAYICSLDRYHHSPFPRFLVDRSVVNIGKTVDQGFTPNATFAPSDRNEFDNTALSTTPQPTPKGHKLSDSMAMVMADCDLRQWSCSIANPCQSCKPKLPKSPSTRSLLRLRLSHVSHVITH